ncbi:zinc-ribbon domain-containing protein [Tropicimonas marinistellae]|uniref:zinc-ribbon domain-containing protein n=1 Tax=Tropicimonas marinistellae TaxID=1739787 RepID=UPI000831596F|nr:zinc-ribbon domain-containing protein [Tropicimonas marinistellae]
MRLICPNCGAQYAVDDRVIPETGRDVQCSNCGNSWFQKHPDFDPELSEELSWESPGAAPVAAPQSPPKPDPVPDAVDEEDTVRAVESSESDATDVEGIADDISDEEPAGASPGLAAESDMPVASGPTDDSQVGGDAEAPSALARDAEPDLAGMGMPRRQQVDESVLSVLREEAEREQDARRAESGLPEFQPDLGVPTPDHAAKRGTADYAVAGADVEEAGQPPEDDPQLQKVLRSSSRRERLPDVEQITSTLEPGDAETVPVRADDPRMRQRRRRGMRIGLGVAFLIFGFAALVYTRSERIVAAVPETADSLASYVASVDAGRFWLDDTFREFIPRAGDNGAEN